MQVIKHQYTAQNNLGNRNLMSREIDIFCITMILISSFLGSISANF